MDLFAFLCYSLIIGIFCFSVRKGVEMSTLSNFFKSYYKLLLLIVAVAVFLFSPIKNHINIDNLSSMIDSARGSKSAPLVFVISYIVGVVFALPGLIFMILAGSIFGFWKGLALVIIGSNLGCQITFFISRALGKDFVSKFFSLNGFYNKLSKKMDNQGFLVMVYLRLIPIFPFNVINYVSGLTSVSHRDYTLGTLLGKLPAIVIYVFLSSRVSDPDDALKNLPLYALILIGFLGITLLIEKKQGVFRS